MLNWLRSIAGLGDHVLGINARNLHWVFPHNPRRAFQVVDDKLLAKARFEREGVPTPKTWAVVRGYRDLAPLRERFSDLPGFVVKPATGSGGRGILVVQRGARGELIVHSRRGLRAIEPDEILEYIAQLLSGLVSPAKLNETVFLEELLTPDELLGGIGRAGLPDLRVITVRGRPVMTMLRVPTLRSRGKANLHQGALGLGVDLASGRTSFAVQGRRRIERHPDTGVELGGIQVPGWEEILSMAARAAGCVEIGYVGVDIIVDKRRGPLVIELNARPGLNIQLANLTGLKRPLREAVDGA
jgi:alpha-L-glutamate ligase-like protein